MLCLLFGRALVRVRELARRSLSDNGLGPNGRELNYLIGVIVLGLFVVRVLVVLDFRLLLEYDIGGSLEEVRSHKFFVSEADIHAALVLNDFFF